LTHCQRRGVRRAQRRCHVPHAQASGSPLYLAQVCERATFKGAKRSKGGMGEICAHSSCRVPARFLHPRCLVPIIKRHPELTPWRQLKLDPLVVLFAAHPWSPQEGPARSGAPPRGWRSEAREVRGPPGLSREDGGPGAGVRHVTVSDWKISGLISPARRFSRRR
jgi:hypothetical protein